MVEHWKSIAAELKHFGKMTGRVLVCFYFPIVVLLVLLHYPYDVDQSVHPGSGFNSLTESESDARLPPRRSSAFYEAVYSGRDQFGVARRRGLDYEKTAKSAAEAAQVPQKVAHFVERYGLRDKKVLEVGSGRGYLQDLVTDYTGLDISAAAARNYHKNFVVASATDMPFADSSFDAIWTIWVLEHVPNPERALREMRRVLKPGGKLYLHVAWGCQPWLADGFGVRPYSDFNWKGKLIKASLHVRENASFLLTYLPATRLLRWAQYHWAGKNEPLRFRALEPNYDVYWQPDSDAAIGLDSFEALLWHTAQGDSCLNCEPMLSEIDEPFRPLIIEIKK